MEPPPKLPVSWADATCVLFEKRFYMFGGYSPDSYHQEGSAWLFDTVSGQYSSVAPPPRPMHQGAIAVLVGNRICLFGGNLSTANYELDLKNDDTEWVAKKDIPNGRLRKWSLCRL